MTFFVFQKLRARDLNDLITVSLESKDSAVTDGTTTSTTFTNSLTTTGVIGVAFTAPASGKVEVKWTCTGRNSNAGVFTITGFDVRNGSTVGSGSVAFAVDENVAVAVQSDSAGQQLEHTGIGLATGLTPYADYNACIVYRVTANTGTFNRRRISVQTA